MCKFCWAKCAKPACLWALALFAVPLTSLAADAGAAQTLHTRALAATCAQCHGTEGHALSDEALPSLAGRSEAELLALLLAFRAGQRPATVMQQLTRGYSPEQLQTLARYFSTQTAPATR